MTTGILVVDKPTDWTSHDVVAKLRGVFREKRVGHAGTLDPLATGVLPVFFGRATRVVEFAMESQKEYIAGLCLGVRTDTQDLTGSVLETREQSVSPQALEAVLPQFRGEIMQIPPMYSAIKIQGKRLYELARKGKEVERPPRPITIHGLELLPQRGAKGEYYLRILCSKGTYVRTICHDIGAVLGCGGAMSSLQRTLSGGYGLDVAHGLDQIVTASVPQEFLLPVDSFFTQEKLVVTEEQRGKIRNGAKFQLSQGQCVADGQYRIYGQQGEFLSLSQVSGGEVSTIKSFYEVDNDETG